MSVSRETARRSPATDADMAAFRRGLAELLAIASERRAKMIRPDVAKRGGESAA